MKTSAKLKFRLHRAVIVLFCLTLLVAAHAGRFASLVQNHQRQRNPQLEELAARWRAGDAIAPLMRSETPDNRINAVLRQLTQRAVFWMPASMMNRAILYSRWRKRQYCARQAGAGCGKSGQLF